MSKQIMIYCPTYKDLTEQDKKEIDKEIEIILLYKKRYKEYLKELKKRGIK